jgi:tetratricopeptide (TPR) repeat protein
MRLASGRCRQRLFTAILLLFAILLSGCATQTQSLLSKPSPALPRRAELDATPFFAQERYQCGPAALAMALRSAGIAATPEALVSQVYVPQREGSLPPEMLVAARRNGAFSMTIPPTLDALLTEIAAGNPIIVLQNLSLQWFPMWHYAVAIGYDLDQAELVLRSGTTERMTLPLSTFEHTWSRSDYWGMVTLPAGRLPATARQGEAVDALVAYEASVEPASARSTYQAALKRWPHDLTLQLGAGNTAYAAGDRTAAAAAYRRATEDHPDSAAAFNNLATVLGELGQFEAARHAAESAIALGGTWRTTAEATLRTIDAAQRSKMH